LHVRLSEREIYDFFEKESCKVRDIRLITDRNSRKSKGIGYIEFYEISSVEKAIKLSGKQLRGQSVMIQPSQAEKNLVPSMSHTHSANSAAGPTRLYVGSLHVNITEDDLRLVFEPFGDIDFVQIHIDAETKKSKGFGFVQYKRAEDAKKALSQINGLELAGRQIKVGLVNETKSEPIGTLGELDDEGGGLPGLNAQSRAMLMAKLMDQHGITPPPTLTSALPNLGVFNSMNATINSPTIGQSKPAPNIASSANQKVSRCVLLKNMFDPSQETDPDFHIDIHQDVQEECSKFGPIKHLHVAKDSPGFVYIKFEAQDGALNAITALNHRWFAGRMIIAEYFDEIAYNNKFPESVEK